MATSGTEGIYRGGTSYESDVAGLLSQFSVFAIPPLLWYQIRRFETAWKRCAGGFCLAGIAVVGVTFVLVGLLWGLESMTTGWRYSFFSFSDYVTGYVERGLSVAGNPVGWAFYEARTVRAYAFWYLFGAVALLASYRNPKKYDPAFVWTTAMTVVLLCTPRLIRQGPLYRLLPFVLLMGLAALGIQALFDSDTLKS